VHRPRAAARARRHVVRGAAWHDGSVSSSADAPTPDEQRAAARAAWEKTARGWDEHREWIEQSMGPVSHAMIEAVAPQPGHVVLEAAAGLGETGLLAAELVHPGGKVIISDGAEAMVEAAKRRVEEHGAGNVEVTPMELEWLDMDAASVDAVLVRFGYMLVPDPETALRDARRVIRPGGRLAFAVWDDVARNPWIGAGMDVLAGHGLAEWPLPAGTPGPFALSDRERLLELVTGAGFVLPEIATVELTFRSPDVATARERFVGVSGRARVALEQAPAEQRAAAEQALDAMFAAHRDPAGPEGAIALPGVAMVVAADA
jgi:SAM-dependent methyltransferase